MNYQHYAIEDFLLDKKFRDWVEQPDEGLESFWNAFLAAHPGKIEEVRTAREMLQKMKFKNHALSADEVSGLWTGILQKRDQETFQKTDNTHVVPLYPTHPIAGEKFSAAFFRKRYINVAASITLLCISAVLFLWINIYESEEIYTTAYGETKTIPLPDGSVATLNANSRLRVPEDWKNDQAREVWLEGEAFFEVQKISQNDNLNAKLPYKFIVHSEGVAVEVLGTKFNVNTRREKVQVVLNSGRVRLKWKEKEMLMQPGELVEVSKAGHEISQRIVKPEAYSSWKDHHLLCDATPLQELAHTIEDRFGYQLVIQDEQMKDITVSGTIPLDSIETLQLVISRLIKANVELQGNKLVIHK
ncbi:FecR family protein [Catalinimonas niigatensis]|uniref:FecR family protein n=1 Tax=Catalinimonas niigatensis TaxID=1397264 RepID=UPI0026651BFB|nr:FecR domain-containing protein [Catalinimonas niigatensis]WPP50730.1 FecR domain-containing protein [Catalinimonas niigatensis]